jgi:hypothetical protein
MDCGDGAIVETMGLWPLKGDFVEYAVSVGDDIPTARSCDIFALTGLKLLPKFLEGG